METEINNNLANEVIYRLKNYQKQYVYNRRLNKALLSILFIIIAIHVFYVKILKF